MFVKIINYTIVFNNENGTRMNSNGWVFWNATSYKTVRI